MHWMIELCVVESLPVKRGIKDTIMFVSDSVTFSENKGKNNYQSKGMILYIVFLS